MRTDEVKTFVQVDLLVPYDVAGIDFRSARAKSCGFAMFHAACMTFGRRLHKAGFCGGLPREMPKLQDDNENQIVKTRRRKMFKSGLRMLSAYDGADGIMIFTTGEKPVAQ